ncbi:TetR/AcrR family transcriptional regulator [Sorangium sp. So ce381]|uniref:TetR/AcrR family transcriptional regulator n=1 Tax=Sorangium sp. So ce381 TaxID=3133307 RepID=UPI003F5C78F5
MRKRDAITPRKQPTQDRSRATVEAILQATAYILVRDGYARLTTNRVAQRAGVNVASLYQFFPGKEALVAELHRRHIEQGRAAAAAVLAAHQGQSPDRVVRTIVEAGIAAHAVEPELHRVFLEQMPRIKAPRSAASEGFLLEEAKQLLSAWGCPAPEVELAWWMMQTAAHAVVHQAIVERPDDVRSGALAEELVQLLERYLRGKQTPAPRAGAGREDT